MHLHGLSYILEIIRTELTTEKTRELVARKYCADLQSLPIPTHYRKGTNYNSILVIVGWLTKMIHYKPVQITIDAPRLPRLDCQRLRLSLHLQVLVPPVPLSSSTAVTTYASPAKTMYAKSLSAGPLGLRAWIWLSQCEVGMVNLSPPDRVRFRA